MHKSYLELVFIEEELQQFENWFILVFYYFYVLFKNILKTVNGIC